MGIKDALRALRAREVEVVEVASDRVVFANENAVAFPDCISLGWKRDTLEEFLALSAVSSFVRV